MLLPLLAVLCEADIEQGLLEQLAGLGYAVASETVIGPDGSAPEREAHADVLLLRRLEAAIDKLNPAIPPEARHDALMQVVASASPSLIEGNRRLHRLLVEGVPVEYPITEGAEDGTIRGDRVWLVDLEDPEANDWLAVSQFVVIEFGQKRRADLVLFVNGLPLVVIDHLGLRRRGLPYTRAPRPFAPSDIERIADALGDADALARVMSANATALYRPTGAG